MTTLFETANARSPALVSSPSPFPSRLRGPVFASCRGRARPRPSPPSAPTAAPSTALARRPIRSPWPFPGRPLRLAGAPALVLAPAVLEPVGLHRDALRQVARRLGHVPILGAGGEHLDRTPRRAEASAADDAIQALFSEMYVSESATRRRHHHRPLHPAHLRLPSDAFKACMRAARIAQVRPPRRSDLLLGVSPAGEARASVGDPVPDPARPPPPDAGFARMAAPDDAPAAATRPRAVRGACVCRGTRSRAPSVGGQETCIVLPQLRLAFDSGRCPQRCVYADTMCLSHTHMDHVGGAGFYIATRSLLSLPPPTILMPASRTVAFAAFVDAMRRSADPTCAAAVGMEPFTRNSPGSGKQRQRCSNPRSHQGAGHERPRATRVTHADRTDSESSVSAEEEDASAARRHEHRISKRPPRSSSVCHHAPVPSQGYVACGTKEKLKAAFIGSSASEIKALKARGVEITDTWRFLRWRSPGTRRSTGSTARRARGA